MTQTEITRLTILPGAPKTASTHLQMSFRAAAATLAECGIAVMLPGTTRRVLQPLAKKLRDTGPSEGLSQQVSALIAAHAAGAKHLFVLDENILGGTKLKMFHREGRLFPWAGRRLKRIQDLFPGAETTIGLAVRDPATFMPSVWSEEMSRTVNPIPFEDFTRSIDIPALRWQELIKRIQGTCKPHRFLVWRYEDYSRDPAQIFKMLLADKAASVTIPNQRPRAGMSQLAVEWLFSRSAPSLALLKMARQKYPVGTEHLPFSPWPQQVRDNLHQIYNDDLHQVARLQGVEILSR